jgi:hypothetical protein
MPLINTLKDWASLHKTLLFVFFILAATCIIHVKSITKPPVSKHSWTQSDWYALSLGFLDNGMDFFHPQTYVLMQLPDSSKDLPRGITSVDFPVHPYLAACLMKITGFTHPVVYRSLSLILSLIGLFFFFFAIKHYADNFWLAATGMCFFLFQPTFAYYQDGFIPSFHALSHYLIGLYFLTRYISGLRKNTLNFSLAILFFTIAALTRFPFLIHLLAILISLVLVSYIQRRLLTSELLLTLLGLMIVSGYFIYNSYLARTYGSAFLNHPLPASGLGDFFNSIFKSLINNIRTVFPPIHLLLLIVFGFLVIRSINRVSVSSGEKFFLSYIAVSLSGVVCYGILMIKQFPAHDYYVADTLLPLLAGMFIFGSRLISLSPGKNYQLVILFFIAGSFNVCLEYQVRLYSKEILSSPQCQTYNNFEGSDGFLKQQRIPENPPVLVVGSYEPNIPFIQLKRKGFQVRVPEYEAIQEALRRDYECAITQNSFFDEILIAYPDWNKVMKSFATNGKITLWHHVK